VVCLAAAERVSTGKFATSALSGRLTFRPPCGSNFDVEFGVIEGLVDPQVGGAGTWRSRFSSSSANRRGWPETSRAGTLNVDRRRPIRSSESGPPYPPGGNEKIVPGNSRGSDFAQHPHIVRGGPVVLVQRDQNVRVLGADRRGVAVGHVDRAVSADRCYPGCLPGRAEESACGANSRTRSQ